MPVRLRAGGRSIGGAMSWGEPKGLRPFAAESPFFGLSVPEDVTVSAQVMAQPDPTLAARTIASLADGTPLVTAKRIEAGQVVLIHTSANAEWSTLPLSGLFVQMLERLAISTRPTQPTVGRDGRHHLGSRPGADRIRGGRGGGRLARRRGRGTGGCGARSGPAPGPLCGRRPAFRAERGQRGHADREDGLARPDPGRGAPDGSRGAAEGLAAGAGARSAGRRRPGIAMACGTAISRSTCARRGDALGSAGVGASGRGADGRCLRAGRHEQRRTCPCPDRRRDARPRRAGRARGSVADPLRADLGGARDSDRHRSRDRRVGVLPDALLAGLGRPADSVGRGLRPSESRICAPAA